MGVGEQRIAENQGVTAEIVALPTAPNEICKPMKDLLISLAPILPLQASAYDE